MIDFMVRGQGQGLVENLVIGNFHPITRKNQKRAWRGPRLGKLVI